jgi:hypothetical protein
VQAKLRLTVVTAVHLQANDGRTATEALQLQTRLASLPSSPPAVSTLFFDSSSGLAETSFSATIANNLTLRLLVDGVDVSGSPHNVSVVAGPPNAANTVFTATPTSVAAGDIITVRGQTYDDYGNLCRSGGAPVLCVAAMVTV